MPTESKSLKDLIAVEITVAEEHTLKTLRVPKDEASKKLLAKKGHDLESAVETMRLAVDSIKGGYRFEDAAASSKIRFMENSIKTLQAELEFFKSLLLP